MYCYLCASKTYLFFRYVSRGRSGDASSSTTAEWIRSGSYELESLGRRYPAKAHLRAPFDPDGRRIRGQYDPEEMRGAAERLADIRKRLKA